MPPRQKPILGLKLRLPDRLKRALSVLLGTSAYSEDGLTTSHIPVFNEDRKFLEAYTLGKATSSWREADLRWRVYVACWVANKVKELPGDFVECGVNRGGISRAVIHYVDFETLNKKFYLLDTFNGFPENLREVASKANLDDYEDCYNAVLETFRPFPRVKIVRGPVPQTLPQVDSDRISYLSIDMNVAEPEIAAAEYFWGKMVPGGVILLDDYCYSRFYERQRRAFDEFVQRRGSSVLAMPTGQGLIFKQ